MSVALNHFIEVDGMLCDAIENAKNEKERAYCCFTWQAERPICRFG
jgi:hypothetical protein